MGLINDFIGFLIERKLGKEPDEGVDMEYILMNRIEHLEERVKQLEKKVYLPSERSHTKQSGCLKSNAPSEYPWRSG